MQKKYVIALDAGTTSVRAMVFDLVARQFIFTAQQEVGQSFPQSGWVEQDAGEIFFKAAYVLNRCRSAVDEREIAGIGIANQRETVVLWDSETGEPVAPAIVWQCRRTSAFCASVPPEMRERIREKTGLPVDAYFSASKIRWLLDHVPAARELLARGRLRAGTVDSFLIWRFTEGRSFVTDHTNASRTMLFNIHTLSWDGELLDYFGIPASILPEVRSSDARMGEMKLGSVLLPLAGVAGDQQAALFGQACTARGDCKVTYGTGLFMLFHTGERCVRSESGLISTIAYTLGGRTCYALEGSAFNAGSGIQWPRDGLGLSSSSAESELVASSVPDAGGVYFVPAFTGLGAPYWRSDCRGLFSGITRGTTRAHLVRAVLESIAFEAKELAVCMEKDSGFHLTRLKCDGGASANDLLMQFQADVLHIPVDRPKERESTALGAALLCACALGLADETSAAGMREGEKLFLPSPDEERFNALYLDYLQAVRRSLL